MDLDHQLERWAAYLSRHQWERNRADAAACGDLAGVAAADTALASLPAVTAMEALQANVTLVSVLSVQRWIALHDARAQGATLAQIGKILGVSRQSAWEVFQRKIADQQRSAAPPSVDQPDGKAPG